MFAKDLISTIIPTVESTDSGNKVLGWMDFYKVSHLPIVKDHEYIGLISETEIYNLDCGDQEIGSFNLSVMRPFVYEMQHLWEVVALFSKFRLSVVPVLDERESFVGTISLTDFSTVFSKLTSADQIGSIIVLEIGVRDYSLTEISRIVEENDAKVLSVSIGSRNDTTLIDVTLKL
ncbi:MAG: CBS domain-containing protein, partial [Bacteroidales bacterium]|nr:CBS domain-containing protein [Bacteroidales bacterium]